MFLPRLVPALQGPRILFIEKKSKSFNISHSLNNFGGTKTAEPHSNSQQTQRAGALR